MTPFVTHRLHQCLSVVLLLMLLASLASPALSANQSAKVAPFKRDPSSAALKWANEELRKMSLEEKVGQLISVGVNATFLNQDSDAYRTLKRHVEENKIGGIILFRGPVYESVILVNRMQQLARYPLLVSADLEAGAGMRFDDTVNFPWNMAVAATGNPDFARRQGEITGREARALEDRRGDRGAVGRRPACPPRAGRPLPGSERRLARRGARDTRRVDRRA